MNIEKVRHLDTFIDVIGSDELVSVVLSALKNEQSLSIARMSDGEEKILSYCKTHPYSAPMLQFGPDWGRRFGVFGITCGEMKFRLDIAAKTSTFFAPDGGEEFFLKHYPYRPPFAEIYFPHRWTRAQRIKILEAAKQVLVINADPTVAQRMEKSPFNPGADIGFLSLTNWQESDSVIKMSAHSDAPLVFLSGGPASKYLAPEIAKQGKVVLDMGSAAPHFWCTRGLATCPTGCRAVARVE